MNIEAALFFWIYTLCCKVLCMWQLLWMGMDDGRLRGVCRGWQGIAGVRTPCVVLWKRRPVVGSAL
jgi:hypothetical protein